MSLDTGKKLGITSALIFVIAPVIIASLYAVFFISLIGNISSTISNGGLSNGGIFPTFSLASFGFILLAIVVAVITIIIGLILFLIAMYELSHYYNELGIFRNIIYALIVGIVGEVIIATVTVALSFVAFANGFTASSATSFGLSFIGIFLGVTIASVVVAIVSAILVMRAFNKLGDKSEVHSFNTAGILFLIGAIIPVVAWIGFIFVLSGFISLKPKPVEVSTNSGILNSPDIGSNLVVCPQCGTENTINSLYCWSCGKQLK